MSKAGDEDLTTGNENFATGNEEFATRKQFYLEEAEKFYNRIQLESKIAEDLVSIKTDSKQVESILEKYKEQLQQILKEELPFPKDTEEAQ